MLNHRLTSNRVCWKKAELNDRFEQGNVNIIERTLRALATFIVAGNNVARVIRQLPNFKPAAVGKAPPTGPYKMGTLDNRTVIHDPFLSNSNRYIMGYKGDSFLTAGFVYAPYIPYGYLRHYQVTDNENSVNCWKLREYQTTKKVTMFDRCGQSAAKTFIKKVA